MEKFYFRRDMEKNRNKILIMLLSLEVLIEIVLAKFSETSFGKFCMNQAEVFYQSLEPQTKLFEESQGSGATLVIL